MVVGGVIALEGGATIARRLFPLAGVPGTVALRLGFGAAFLAVHHLAFYAAVDRLPLGVAVTLEFCGPLAVAIVGSRRVSHLVWTLLAVAGVVLASGVDGTGHWDLVGVLLQAHALARLLGRVFSVLSSPEPAVGALFGLLALHQQIHSAQWIGVLAVCVAAAATGLDR